MKGAFLVMIRAAMVVLLAAFALDVLWLIGIMSGSGPPIAGNHSIPASYLPKLVPIFVAILVMLVLLPVLFAVAPVAEKRLSRPDHGAKPPAA
jgi:hypothetical protein